MLTVERRATQRSIYCMQTTTAAERSWGFVYVGSRNQQVPLELRVLRWTYTPTRKMFAVRTHCDSHFCVFVSNGAFTPKAVPRRAAPRGVLRRVALRSPLESCSGENDATFRTAPYWSAMTAALEIGVFLYICFQVVNNSAAVPILNTRWINYITAAAYRCRSNERLNFILSLATFCSFCLAYVGTWTKTLKIPKLFKFTVFRAAVVTVCTIRANSDMTKTQRVQLEHD